MSYKSSSFIALISFIAGFIPWQSNDTKEEFKQSSSNSEFDCDAQFRDLRKATVSEDSEIDLRFDCINEPKLYAGPDSPTNKTF